MSRCKSPLKFCQTYTESGLGLDSEAVSDAILVLFYFSNSFQTPVHMCLHTNLDSQIWHPSRVFVVILRNSMKKGLIVGVLGLYDRPHQGL